MINATTPPPSSGKLRTLLERSISTVILLGLLTGVLVWNQSIGYYGLVACLCALTAWEWRTMLINSGKAAQPTLGLVFHLAYPLILLWLCECGYSPLTVLMAVVLVPFLLVVTSFTWEMRRPMVGSRALRAVATTLLSFIYPGGLFAMAIPALQFAYFSGGVQGQGVINLVLWVVLVTKMADIFAYVSGVIVGGKFFSKKLIPHISPKKTWEGIIGSFILTQSAGVGFIVLMWGGLESFPVPAVTIFFIQTLFFILSVIGDLAGSLIKRSLAIKDSGSLLPGIGGVFDLIDSPSFTVPFVYLALWIGIINAL